MSSLCSTDCDFLCSLKHFCSKILDDISVKPGLSVRKATKDDVQGEMKWEHKFRYIVGPWLQRVQPWCINLYFTAASCFNLHLCSRALCSDQVNVMKDSSNQNEICPHADWAWYMRSQPPRSQTFQRASELSCDSWGCLEPGLDASLSSASPWIYTGHNCLRGWLRAGPGCAGGASSWHSSSLKRSVFDVTSPQRMSYILLHL